MPGPAVTTDWRCVRCVVVWVGSAQADKLLAGRMKEQVYDVIKLLPEKAQCTLFSTTMPLDVLEVGPIPTRRVHRRKHTDLGYRPTDGPCRHYP